MDDAVSARNNSSVILLAQLGENNFLFTGDAGVLALNHAADYAESNNFNIAESVRYKQIPHHGSKRNVGPSVLDRIVGPIIPEGEKRNKIAFISASTEGMPEHPSNRVKNALVRRGCTVSATQGQDHCYHSLDVPTRKNWVPITPLEFTSFYEEEN